MHLDLSFSAFGHAIELTFGQLADETVEVFHDTSDLTSTERAIPFGFSSESLDEEDDNE